MKFYPLNEFYSLAAPEVMTKKTLRNLYNTLEQKSKFPPYFATNPDILSTLPINSDVYLMAAFLPPGKIDSYFSQSELLYHSLHYIPENNSELRAYFTLPVRKKKVRVFTKPKSVFKNWREDTPNYLAQAYKLDFERSKIPRMIRTKIEYDEIYETLKKKYAYIKEEFSSIIVKSSYPHITWNDFTLYCQQKRILCKEITLSVLDRLFIAVNVDLDGGGEDEGNPDRELCRSEFLEIIVRIASAKYKDTKKVKFLIDALNLFLEEYTNSGVSPNIHEFRLKELWTLPVDDLLRSNLGGIYKVFTRYSGLKRYLTPQEVVDLIAVKCKYNIYESEIIKAYGYSKMTIKDEADRFGIILYNPKRIMNV